MTSVMHHLKRPAAIMTGLSFFSNLYVMASWFYAFYAEDNYKTSTRLYERLFPFNYTYMAVILCLLIFFSFIYLVRWIEEQRFLKIFMIMFQSAALALLVFSVL